MFVSIQLPRAIVAQPQFLLPKYGQTEHIFSVENASFNAEMLLSTVQTRPFEGFTSKCHYVARVIKYV